ncbi:hypothetical protein [Cellulosimicrobium composti]|uniref:hypothetical protein n=1 Tax=Cellulosimicrobium composti TaxID=2672572 RepID=UPI00379D0422
MGWIQFPDALKPLSELPEKNRQHVTDAGFEELLTRYQTALEWLRAIDREPVDELPPSVVQNADAHARTLTTAMTFISEYEPSRATGGRSLKDVNNNVNSVLAWWRESARPHIKGGAVTWSDRLTQIDAEEQRIADLRGGVEKASKESEQLLATVRKLTEEAGTGELAHYYSKQAKRHANGATGAL